MFLSLSVSLSRSDCVSVSSGDDATGRRIAEMLHWAMQFNVRDRVAAMSAFVLECAIRDSGACSAEAHEAAEAMRWLLSKIVHPAITSPLGYFLDGVNYGTAHYNFHPIQEQTLKAIERMFIGLSLSLSLCVYVCVCLCVCLCVSLTVSLSVSV